MDGTKSSRASLTELLDETVSGRRESFDEIFSAVYEELRRLAHHQLMGGWRKYTLDTTALVHEAYLKLVDAESLTDRHRGYFFGAAARAMRQVLVDAARRRQQLKRGGGRDDLTYDDELAGAEAFATELIMIDDTLEQLAENYPRQARVVECRFFGGLTIEETATALDLSRRTVIRDWELARAWLFRQLGEDAFPIQVDEAHGRPAG